MAFVKIAPQRTVSACRTIAPVEFGVGYRIGGASKSGKRMDTKLRLRPKMLGPAAAFIVTGTWVDVSFDSETRRLLIEPGADFRLFRPGRVIGTETPILLTFPLPAGVKAEKFILPATDLVTTLDYVSFRIPAGAFAAGQAAEPAAPAASPQPAPPAAKKQPYVGALAGVPHPVRKVS